MAHEYSNKNTAVRDISLLEDALRVTPEIDDGKWVMLSKKEFEAIEEAARDVAQHLETCMDEIEAIEESVGVED
ncbi:hypothetical protein M5E06_21110 [Azospirillum sp. A1-3]|uniref:hypothetical protein n=1 Tax=Azospirillum sp. A1-3 TaxID=185874 RepID=UPI002076DFE9|nr:hypothetical protein [Azospirillum sp. A1-3]MCM8736630.1 hypothetical protein [Azospirillum sp. A1-3]